MKHSTFLLAATMLGLFTTTDSAVAQWVQVGLPGLHVHSLAASGSDVFAGTWGQGVFRSTDYGASWTAVNNGLTTTVVTALVKSGSDLFAGTYGGGVFRLSANGETWTPVNSGLTDSLIFSLAIGPNPTGGTYLYAGCNYQIFRSNDEGKNWDLLLSGAGYTLAPRGTYIFTSDDFYPYTSSNYGESWSVGPAYFNLHNWAFTPNLAGGFNVFFSRSTGIYGGGGLFLSIDSGRTWQRTNLPSNNVTTLGVSGRNLFVYYAQGWSDPTVGLFLTTDNGTSWTDVNAGLTNVVVNFLVLNGPFLFAGTRSHGVWRRALSEMITGIEDNPQLPASFTLEQNYPNPFNPSTTISYQLPTQSHVMLELFDALGREVASLVNETKDPGRYEAVWDASGIASGVYFCRMQAGGFAHTRKLLLVK